MTKVKIFILFLSILIHLTNQQQSLLTVVNQWRQIDVLFPTPNDRANAILNGNYILQNNVAVDVQPQFSSGGLIRNFVTVPRFSRGVPASLLISYNGNPLLTPYPSYEWHSSHGSNCNGITSAIRVAITACNQLWVIDTGRIGDVQACPPQLLMFDLSTDTLAYRFRFDTTVYAPRRSLLLSLAIKIDDPPPSGRCARTKIYIGDCDYPGLVVYDHATQSAWRVQHSSMLPDPNYAVHTIGGQSFTLNDGMFGLSILNNNLVYHPLASDSEYTVPLNVVDDRTAFIRNVNSYPNSFTRIGRRNVQTAIETADNFGNLYFVTFDPIRLVSWNSNNPYNPSYFRVLSQDQSILQFASGMKIVVNPAGRNELWLLTNRFQKVSSNTLNLNEINFRIIRIQLDYV